MDPEIIKLKTLYQQLDRQQAAGDDVVADLKKEINNLELAYLKQHVLPQVAQYLASKVRDLRCGIDTNFQFDGENSINYSFCTSNSMLFVTDTLSIHQNMEEIHEETENIYENNYGIGRDTSENKTSHLESNIINLRVEKYSEKAIVVYGDTKTFSKELKQIGGYFNSRLRGGPGWIFSKKKLEDINKLFGPIIKNQIPKEDIKQNKGDLFSQAGVEIESTLSENQWIELILSMRCMKYRDYVSPHKAIFLLTVIKGIEEGNIRENKIYTNHQLEKSFNELWNKFVPNSFPFRANFFHPFIHMSGEPFYYLVNIEDNESYNLNQNWTRNLVERYVKYAYFDKQLFSLFYKKGFRNRLSKELIKNFIKKQRGFINETVQKSDTSSSNLDKFEQFKLYLSTLKSNLGKPFSLSSINVYASSLRSSYMRSKIAKFADTSDLEKVFDISIIDKIISEVKYDTDLKIINSTPYIALKMFRDFRRLYSTHNDIPERSYTNKSTLSIEYNDILPIKPIGILEIEVGNIRIKDGNYKEMFIEFLNKIGPRKVYKMRINYLGTNLIDTEFNQFYKDSCFKLNGNFWVNVSPRPKTIVNQILKICEHLNLNAVITLQHEDIKDGYKIYSKPRK